MRKQWIIGVFAMALCLAAPGIASAQCDTTEADMLAAFDDIEDLAGSSIEPDADYDGDGVPERDMMGAFGRLCETGMLSTAIQDAFAANRAQALVDIGSFGAALAPGFEETIGYLASVFPDGDPTDGDENTLDTITGFADALGGPGASRTMLQPDYDASQAAAIIEACYAELGISNVTVFVSGPDDVFVGFGGTFTATTIDMDDPMFSETHTFSSSNSAVLEHLGGGVFMGKVIGTADVIATGDTSAVVGTRTVNVVAPEWHEVCSIDNTLLGDFNNLVLAAGCLFAGTNVPGDVDIGAFGPDGVPDINQLALAAFTLCDGSVGPDQAQATAEFNANQATLAQYFDDLDTVLAWLNGDGGTTVDISPNGGTIDIMTTPSGETLQLSATTSGVISDTTHNWTESSGGSVVTVDGTGLVTAVASGTAMVMATGDVSGITDTVTVTVFDLDSENRIAISGASDICLDDDPIQLTATTTGADSGETHTFSLSSGTSVTVSGSGLVTPVGTGTSVVSATGDVSAEVATVSIEVFACTGPCDQPDSKKATTENTTGQLHHKDTIAGTYFLSTAISEAIELGLGTATGTGGTTDLTFLIGTLGDSGVDDLLNGINDFADALAGLSAVDDGSAAWAGLTTDHSFFFTGFLDGVGTFPSGSEMDELVNGGASVGFDIPTYESVLGGVKAVLDFGEGAVGGDYGTTTACSGGTAPCPGLEFLTSLDDPALADLAAFPASYTTPLFAVIDGAKLAGEPYDDDTVFAPGVNPSDLTNQEVSDLVAAAGGDELDFVALAAGLSVFGPGSPFLPVGGALLMGVLAGGLAALGARRLRRG